MFLQSPDVKLDCIIFNGDNRAMPELLGNGWRASIYVGYLGAEVSLEKEDSVDRLRVKRTIYLDTRGRSRNQAVVSVGELADSVDESTGFGELVTVHAEMEAIVARLVASAKKTSECP